LLLIEKTLSIAAKVAEIPKKSLAILPKIGNLDLFSFQNFKGSVYNKS